MPIDIEIAGYELHREIGEGGMARVFLGTQTSLGREVAIKVLRGSLSGEDFQQRFLHEGQLLAKLNHPNIVPIHDIGQSGELYYMAMEYLKGGTLSERMVDGISVAEVIRICTQVAHALHLAHTYNIVHRDMKPSNIMFRDELTPVLTDFGIARKTDAQHRLTKTGMVVGTPYYMSPEQITGKDVDGRADLYSLGIMFFELLTGDLPFRAEEPLALAMQHVQETPPQLPDSVAELQPIMDLMLAKDRDHRFPDMLAFCEAIKELVMSERAFAERLSGETKLFNSDQFSDPRFGSGPLRVPERVTRDLARATGRRSQPSGATRVARTGETESSGRPRWLLPAVGGLAAAVVLAVVLMFTLGGDGLSDAEKRVVENLLKRVDAFLVIEQIDQPPGENAAETLARIFDIAPGYPAAIERAEEIAVFYERYARDLLGEDDLEAAGERTAAGLALAPEYEPLVDLDASIKAQLAARELRRKVIDLNLAAQRLYAEGKLMTPEGDNALALYEQALELDPLNEAASEGRKRIQESVVGRARDALLASELETAEQHVSLLEEKFGNTSLIAEVRQELDAEVRQRREQQQLAELLSEARELMASGALVDPPGASASDRFQAVLRLRPQNEEALQGLATIAARYDQQARQALADENYVAAVDLASAGLRADASNRSLLAVQEQATNALSAVDREIQQSLQRAERLVQDGRLLSSDGNTALAAFKRVLELDPDNARARDAIARLPDQAYQRAQQLQRAGSLGEAQTLLSLAASNYPAEARFSALSRTIQTQMDAQAQQQRLAGLLDNTRRLIAARPMSAQAATAAADALDAVAREFPNDVEVVSQRRQLTQAVADRVEEISLEGQDDNALQLADLVLARFPNNAALVQARDGVTDRQARREQERLARIAAMSGRLAIDAAPWGEVVQIEGPEGRTPVPDNATTPLVLSLVEGDYTVLVRGANAADPVRLNVTVQRQQLVRARAEFPGLDANSYFERSGW